MYENNIDGYVTLNDVEAKELAEKTMKAIEDYRLKLYNEYVDRELKARNEKISKKWFGKKTLLTGAEMQAILNREREEYNASEEGIWRDHPLESIELACSDHYLMAYNIANAVNNRRKQFFISINMYNSLLRWAKI